MLGSEKIFNDKIVGEDGRRRSRSGRGVGESFVQFLGVVGGRVVEEVDSLTDSEDAERIIIEEVVGEVVLVRNFLTRWRVHVGEFLFSCEFVKLFILFVFLFFEQTLLLDIFRRGVLLVSHQRFVHPESVIAQEVDQVEFTITASSPDSGRIQLADVRPLDDISSFVGIQPRVVIARTSDVYLGDLLAFPVVVNEAFVDENSS